MICYSCDRDLDGQPTFSVEVDPDEYEGELTEENSKTDADEQGKFTMLFLCGACHPRWRG